MLEETNCMLEVYTIFTLVIMTGNYIFICSCLPSTIVSKRSKSLRVYKGINLITGEGLRTLTVHSNTRIFFTNNNKKIRLII